MTRAKEAVNQAYLASCAEALPFDFLEQEGQWSTTAGSEVYTYASIASGMSITGATIGEILYFVNDIDGPVLKSMSWLDLEKLSFSTQDGDGNGEPFFWSKWASRIRLYPTPDAAYTIGALVRLVPSEMTNNTDTPLIPLQYRHELIVSHAAANLLRQEGGAEAHQEALYHQRIYDQAYIRMRTAHATARVPTFSLKGTGWDNDPSTGTAAPWLGGPQ